ncbi:MAG TPA: type I restriction endonuclease [Proteiniclasticum sp.]|uniref:restriction endonuclease subunit S n=1 Tax=Proteiniclasticum sp. TaxID=2053595 RepID=UPI000E8BDD69|nr:restriction endonuclease subunit S [Proteiniclasticum sp.]HBW13094.1 type I restriction endonuclease [Proteiniclasticum sp.]
MNAQDLKKSILQLAIQGKLVEQREEEGTAKELLKKIEAENKQLIKEGKIKKQKAFPEIKEVEIPFDIPESWEWVRLGEIGQIVGGGTPKTGNCEFWNGGNIPWLTPADMKFVLGKYVENGERFITEKGLKGSSAQLMPKGTIIYSSRAPIGYIAISNNALATNQGFKSFVPYEPRINEYIYYCLIARTNEIISRASGTTFKEISGNEFSLTVVPLPPLEEQKRIVAKIEELMPYVDKYDVAYSEVEELNKKFPENMQKSILQYAMQGKLVEQREEDGTAEDLYKQIQEENKKLIKEGKIKTTKALPEITEDEIPFDIPENWKWIRLGDLCDYGKCNSISAKNIPKDAWILDLEDIEKDSGRIINKKTMKDLKSTSSKHIFKKGDVLYSKLRPYLNKVVVADEDGYSTSEILPLDFGRHIFNKYAQIVLMSPYFINYTVKCSYGVKMPRLGTEDGKLALFPLAPLEEQKRIVDKIEEMLPFTKKLVNR